MTGLFTDRQADELHKAILALADHTGWTRDIRLSPDGNFLFSAGHDMTARLWDITTISSSKSELKRAFTGHDNFIECYTLAPETSYEYLALLARIPKRSPGSPLNCRPMQMAAQTFTS
ncbi:uncharacterized protein BDV17DRAFT_294769 [Aspergillus undulatus]|uniref:uncharacterized protein n=1 Tax=Aspergillus undulatus TaxID=1810928 RepID=UPI003CCDC654